MAQPDSLSARESNKHRVVIVGGGFGGLYAAQRLKNVPVEATLIDRRNFHLFQPIKYYLGNPTNFSNLLLLLLFGLSTFEIVN